MPIINGYEVAPEIVGDVDPDFLGDYDADDLRLGDIYDIEDEEIEAFTDELYGEFDPDDLDLDVLATAIERGDRRALMALIGVNADSLRAVLGVRLLTAFQRVGKAGANKLGVVFNPLDPNYNTFLYQQARETVQQIASQANDTLQGVLLRGLQEGVPLEILAQRIRDAQYLLDRQARQLEALAASLALQGVPVTRRQRRLAQIAAQQRRMRASTIALVLIVTLVTATILLLLNEAIRQGVIAGYRLTWWTKRDERVCVFCGPLHGVSVPQGEKFPGGLDGPPAHPRCRCRLIPRIYIKKKDR